MKTMEKNSAKIPATLRQAPLRPEARTKTENNSARRSRTGKFLVEGETGCFRTVCRTRHYFVEREAQNGTVKA
jgi:hypothetical protein